MPLTAIQQEWVDTLRNSDIKQATGVLGLQNGARCCLGVLCDIAVEHGIIDPPNVDEHYIKYGTAFYHLPITVANWVKIADYAEQKLEFQNDEVGMSFKEIADYIENNASVVFSTKD
jgi:desulfoferrodoxin (superoxide reductase-like protein)